MTTYNNSGLTYNDSGTAYNGPAPVAPSRAVLSGGLNEQLVYIRPDGYRYRIHAPPWRVVVSEEGFGTPPIQYVVDEAPFQHGATVRSFHLKSRTVQLVLMYTACSRQDYWDMRAEILDMLRPNRVTDNNKPGHLKYYMPNGSKRQLDVWSEQGPVFAPRQPGGYRERFFTEAVRFVAHDPVWYDPTVQTHTFVSTAGGSQFFTFKITFPVYFSAFNSIYELPYTGTWLEYPSITLTGPITNPVIYNNTTGDKIALATTIPNGLTATTTLRGSKTVLRSDGVSLLNTLTPDSNLATFSLQPDPQAPNGINEIQIVGTGVGAATSASISWYTRYFGV